MGASSTAANPIPSPQIGTIGVNDEMTFHLRMVTTTAGTVDATKTWAPSTTVTKTATKTGRYTIAMPRGYTRLLNVIVTPIGVDDAVWGATTTGLHWFLRDEDVSGTAVPGVSTSAGDGTFEIQFIRVDTNADAEIPNGTGFMLTAIVARGTTV